MATFSKVHLSESVSPKGSGISMTQTVATGDLIHLTGTSATVIDEVWVYASNTSTSAVKLTVGFGGTSTRSLIEQTIPGEGGLFLVVPGLILSGDGVDGSEVRGWAGTANVIHITGYVNRIS